LTSGNIASGDLSGQALQPAGQDSMTMSNSVRNRGLSGYLAPYNHANTCPGLFGQILDIFFVKRIGGEAREVFIKRRLPVQHPTDASPFRDQ
jgi:hypothetical protein